MSLDVDVTTNGLRVPLARHAVADAARVALRAEGVRDALVSITMLSRTTMARLNRRHLGHTGATDVISFGFQRPSSRDPVVGDIYVCPDVARANAHERGVSVREEVTRLVVHGTLHVLGYDHPEDESREASAMWSRQERIVRRLLAASRVRR
jgi:probable rRNA maturation factor